MRSLSEVAAGIDAALAEAGDVPLACYRPDELVGFLADLERARARLDALIARGLTTADEAGVASAVGQRSVPAAVAGVGNADGRSLGRDLAAGRWLRDFPLVAEAFTDGRLGRRHVEVLRSADNTRTRAHLLEGQAHLIEAAESCAFVEFTQVVAYWVLRADPDGAEPLERERRRRCSIRKNADGSAVGSFQLGAIAGDAVTNAIEREYHGLLVEDRASNDPHRLLRTVSQRRADALVNLITRGAGRSDAAVAPPLVHLVVGWSVAEDLLRRRPDEEVAVPTDRSDPNRRCEFADGTPAHPTEAAEVLAVAELRRLVLHNESEKLELGRAVRCFPAKVKQALIAATGGRCRHPGCDAKITWLETDHINPWSQGGATDVANAQLLCGFHNKRKRDRTPEHDPPPDADQA